MPRSKLDITRHENGRDVLDAKKLTRVMVDNTIGKLSCSTTEGVLTILALISAATMAICIMAGLMGFGSLPSTLAENIASTCTRASYTGEYCTMYGWFFGMAQSLALMAAMFFGALWLAALLSLGHRKLVKDDVLGCMNYYITHDLMEKRIFRAGICVMLFGLLCIETNATQWLMPVDEQPPAISASYDRFNPGLSTANGGMSPTIPDYKPDLNPAPHGKSNSWNGSPEPVFPGQPGYGAALDLNQAKYGDDRWTVNGNTGTAPACVSDALPTNLFDDGQVTCGRIDDDNIG